jgi:hypothetical protein
LINGSEYNDFKGTQSIPCHGGIYFVSPLARAAAAAAAAVFFLLLQRALTPPRPPFFLGGGRKYQNKRKSPVNEA